MVKKYSEKLVCHILVNTMMTHDELCLTRTYKNVKLTCNKSTIASAFVVELQYPHCIHSNQLSGFVAPISDRARSEYQVEIGLNVTMVKLLHV